MMNSILNSIKKLLGIDSDYDAFDTDIIMNINSVFFKLYQLGIGPRDAPFSISDETAEWSDFSNSEIYIAMVKMYVYTLVRLVFDPPQSSTLADVLQSNADEMQFRLYMQAQNEIENGVK